MELCVVVFTVKDKSEFEQLKGCVEYGELVKKDEFAELLSTAGDGSVSVMKSKRFVELQTEPGA